MRWLALALVLGFTAPLQADTLYLKDKTALKGVVVEEQADRYLVSTVDGEIPVLKSSVERIQHDDPEQAYYYLGRQLQEAGRLRDALAAYERAVALRPDFQTAREAAFAVQRMLWRQDEAQLKDELRQKQLVRQGAGRRPMPRETFTKRFGCALGYEEGWITVAEVDPDGPAARADLRVGDLILTIEREPMTYLVPAEVGQRLNQLRGEIGVTIERAVTVQGPNPRGRDPWGLILVLGYEGLRVAALAPKSPAAGHVMPGDLIVAVGGQPTRYLPLKTIEKHLRQASSLDLTVQRTILLLESSL